MGKKRRWIHLPKTKIGSLFVFCSFQQPLTRGPEHLASRAGLPGRRRQTLTGKDICLYNKFDP